MRVDCYYYFFVNIQIILFKCALTLLVRSQNLLKFNHILRKKLNSNEKIKL